LGISYSFERLNSFESAASPRSRQSYRISITVPFSDFTASPSNW